MIDSMSTAKSSYSLTQREWAYMIYKWDAKNILYDCYNYNHDKNQIDISAHGTYNKDLWICDRYAKIYLEMATGIGLEAERIDGSFLFISRDMGSWIKWRRHI